MKQLIIGKGEIGKALEKILHCDICDKEHTTGKYEVLHIAIPFYRGFIDDIRLYKERYAAKMVIIHSTVEVGTTRQIGAYCVHSPVRGVHPNLEQGIRTFVKHFGGPLAKEASKIFKKEGIQVEIHEKPETTELMKILDTTYYGWNIMYMREVNRICKEYAVPFEVVYTQANEEYNEGYTKLGMENVVRPVLKYMEGKIGGHCVINNTHLIDDWLTETLKQRNETYN